MRIGGFGKGLFLLFIFACSSFKLSIIHFTSRALSSYTAESNSIFPPQSTKPSSLHLPTSLIALWPLQCQTCSSLQYANTPNAICSLLGERLLENNVNQHNFSSSFKELLIGCFQSAVGQSYLRISEVLMVKRDNATEQAGSMLDASRWSQGGPMKLSFVRFHYIR